MAADFVEVYRGGGGQFRAEMLRSLLSGSGIESVVTGGATAAYPTNVGPSGEFVIVVRREEADRAADLLRSFEEEGGAEIEELEWADDEEDVEE
jgi:hypothetical protein